MENRINGTLPVQDPLHRCLRVSVCLGLLLLPAAKLAAFGPAASQMLIEVRGQAPEASHPQISSVTRGPLQREIVDPCLGTRWQLIADTQHPERPGRLVPVDFRLLRAASARPRESPSAPISPPAATLAAPPIIRPGNRITVTQQTSILRARFQAVALESAAAGQTLRVRLLGGSDTLTGNQGTVVDVRAVQAGEAVWLAVDRNPQ